MALSSSEIPFFFRLKNKLPTTYKALMVLLSIMNMTIFLVIVQVQEGHSIGIFFPFKKEHEIPQMVERQIQFHPSITCLGLPKKE